MRDIAEDVGVRAASLYNHFPSKQEILWEIILDAFDELERLRAQGATQLAGRSVGNDPVAHLSVFVRSHVTFHATHASEALLVAGQLSSLDPSRFAHVARLRDKYEQAISHIVSVGARSRVFAVSDVRITTYAILGMGLHVAVWYREDGPLALKRLCDEYEGLALRLVLPGAPAAGGSPARPAG